MNFKIWFENQWWQGMTNTARGQGPSEGGPPAGSIYSQLTYRDRKKVMDQQYDQYGLKNNEKDYSEKVSNLVSELSLKGYKVTKKIAWVHVAMPVQQKIVANYDEAPVSAFKIYRTFTFNPETDNRISKFLASLSGFAEELQKLQKSDPNYPDRMQFKFPDSLHRFFEHSDSLVVHFMNKYNRKRVNDLVDHYFAQAGVRFSDRLARAQDGYDMLPKGNFEGGSHTEVVSQAMEKLLGQSPNYHNLTDAQLKIWLQRWMNYFNNLSPREMYQYLSDIDDSSVSLLHQRQAMGARMI